VTEFDCFVKSFTYLAARLPRSEFLEPFLDEATVEPVENVKKQVAVMKKVQDLQLSEASGFDENAIMAGIQHATGKPPEIENVRENVVPLSEAEPDMYPCLLAMCGSGFGFYKVSAVYFDHYHRLAHHHFVMNTSRSQHTKCVSISLWFP